jgi:hypothetical protein
VCKIVEFEGGPESPPVTRRFLCPQEQSPTEQVVNPVTSSSLSEANPGGGYPRWLQVAEYFDGILTGRIYRHRSQNAYSLRINKVASVLKVAKTLVPVTYKKKMELKTVVDYYTNRITGNEAVARMNLEVLSGSRSSRVVTASLPLVRNKAKKLALVRARGARKFGARTPKPGA